MKVISCLPSIFNETRNFPTGRLQDFVRNRVRLWTIYTHEVGRYGSISASGMLRADSGRVFSLRATNVPLSDIQTQLLQRVLDVDPELTLAGVLRQVADVAVGGEDPVVRAQVAFDRPGLRGALDDHEVL